MNDVNSYADEKLLEFMDAVHEELSRVLRGRFGDDWMDLSVRKHCDQEYFDRVETMLRSPMRVVEMDKRSDELHGIEHLWNIIGGNWSLFKPIFQNRARTEAYLGEITELRHNLAHRRKSHYLLPSHLARVMGSCRMILTALESPRADAFADVVESLNSGRTPWGAPLDGRIPPREEMYSEFVGRPDELKGLSDWLASDSPQVLVCGYGGVGKSALAYKFVRDVRDSSNKNLMAVCWVTAKQREFSEGATLDRPADFSDLGSLFKALWAAIYVDDVVPENLTADAVVAELHDLPVLLVIDDFDTVFRDEDLTAFLLFSLRNTPAKVIYTSRYRVPGLKNLDVPPFGEAELRDFVLQRSAIYGVDQETCLNRVQSIESVTGGYALFVDDLIHHAAFFGIDRALEDWGQRKGDAAREYALRRQIEYLGDGCGEVLIALSVTNRPLKIVEISAIAGLTDDDAESGVRELNSWRMVEKVKADDSDTPAFRMNKNTIRLVQQTFRGDRRTATHQDAFKALTGERVPEAKRAAIAKVVMRAKSMTREKGLSEASDYVLESITGELSNSPDLYGVLGWLYSRQGVERHAGSAREAFEKSHRLGSSKVDTYFHWANLEREIAERMIADGTSETTEDAIAAQWKRSEEAAANGIKRCGAVQVLCYFAGYGASREAKSKGRAGSFSYAAAAYKRSIDWFEQALNAPGSDVASIPLGAIYRGMTLAYEGVEDFPNLMRTLKLWRASSGPDDYLEAELRRLLGTYPELKSSPAITTML